MTRRGVKCLIRVLHARTRRSRVKRLNGPDGTHAAVTINITRARRTRYCYNAGVRSGKRASPLCGPRPVSRTAPRGEAAWNDRVRFDEWTQLSRAHVPARNVYARSSAYIYRTGSSTLWKPSGTVDEILRLTNYTLLSPASFRRLNLNSKTFA